MWVTPNIFAISYQLNGFAQIQPLASLFPSCTMPSSFRILWKRF
jgi:hypothetical protein